MSNNLYADVFDAPYAVLHNPGMDYRQIVRGLMEKTGKNQSELAKILKVEQPTVSRWLKGAQPDTPQHTRIVSYAKKLGVIADGEAPGDMRSEDVASMLPEGTRPHLVRVVGYVSAGQAHPYAANQGDLDEVEAPPNATAATVATRIMGNSLGEFFNRWYAFYDDVKNPFDESLVGELCVVGLSDGRVVIKKVQKTGQKAYRLLSNVESEPPIENARIDWAAKVIDIGPATRRRK